MPSFCLGAFSIFASSYVRGCIGIENSTLCVEDANYNAVKNNVKNCHFMYGSLEKVIWIFKNAFFK